MDFTPDIVQVVPYDDYTVSVNFCDGKIVSYDVKPKLGIGVFSLLEDIDLFKERCTIMNNTLAWDVSGDGDVSKCIDIDPDYLYSLDCIEDPLDSLDTSS